MGRDHHHLAGIETQRIAAGEVNARFRLVVAGQLRPEDAVPRQRGVFRQPRHERDGPVGARRDDVPRLHRMQPRHHVGPRVQPLPRGVEAVGRGHAEGLGHAVEVLEVQVVERDVTPPALADARHGGVVFRPPRHGEAGGVDPWQNVRHLPRDGGPPVHAGAENVEDQGLGHGS
jgi:hypothetical protein